MPKYSAFQNRQLTNY